MAGALCALTVLFAVRFAINETTVPDVLVSPLFVADTAGSADAIVVLGASVVGNCVPNLNGVWRVMLGVRLWPQQHELRRAKPGGAVNASQLREDSALERLSLEALLLELERPHGQAAS